MQLYGKGWLLLCVQAGLVLQERVPAHQLMLLLLLPGHDPPATVAVGQAGPRGLRGAAAAALLIKTASLWLLLLPPGHDPPAAVAVGQARPRGLRGAAAAALCAQRGSSRGSSSGSPGRHCGVAANQSRHVHVGEDQR